MNHAKPNLLKRCLSILMLLGVLLTTQAQVNRNSFDFEFEGVTLNGVLNMPEGPDPKGLVLIIHGSGQTNAVAQEWHQDVRMTLVQAGYAVYMWDKMGCGKSGGTFDYHQPVENSAQEAIAAIKTLQQKQIPGADRIGLWGISRAGWINPIVISNYQPIQFWISVSGVDELENFDYLLENNLRIAGLPEDSINLIVEEWREGNRIMHAGGSFEECSKATQHLSQNAFLRRFSGESVTATTYAPVQKAFMAQAFEEASGRAIYISDFDSLLAKIDCPVLALFGETDKHVDWTKTKSLYERTLGKHTDLTIQSFPNCNHNLFKCKTGGFYEFEDDGLPWNRCDGYLEAIANWLAALE